MERTPLNKEAIVKVADHSFKIEKCIGRGNSSLVYLASDGDKKVVLKEIYPVGLGIRRNSDSSLSVPKKSRDAFKFYCKNAKNVFDATMLGFYNNPQTNNQTPFPDTSGEANNTFYYSTSWSSGDTLENKLDKSGFSLADLIQVCQSIADMLQKYHENEYIHMDIKPSNVFVREDKTIMVFDFDSVFKMDQLRSGFISYSEDYAAPEVRYFPNEIDLHRTDIYSVGVILYKRLFGRLPEEYLYDPSFVPDYSHCKELEKYSPELKGILTKIFEGTLSLLIEDRYKTAGELATALKEAHKIAGKELFVTDMDIRPGNENLVERIDELTAIHRKLAGKKAVFITGLGGCGKTTLAQQYAAHYRKKYSVIQEVAFEATLEKTIKEKIKISNTQGMNCEDKIDVLSETSSDTLIIIDDVTLKKGDGGVPEEFDVLKKLLQISAPVRFIFTSREKWDGSFSNDRSLSNFIFSYEADKYSDDFKEAAKDLFIEIAGEKSRIYENKINEFFNSYDYHIMTVYSIAVYANEVLRNDPDNFEEMLDVLCKSGLSNTELYDITDEDSVYYKINGIFKRLFDTPGYISDVGKYILLNASLLPHEGTIEKDFINMIAVEANKFTGSKQSKELVRKGLLKREIINGIKHISMHPILKEVCQTEWVLVDGFDYDKVFDKFIGNVCEQVLTYRKEQEEVFTRKRQKVRLLLKIAENFILLLCDNKNPDISEETLLPLTKIPGVYAEFDDIKNANIFFSLLDAPFLTERIKLCLQIHKCIAYGLMNDYENPGKIINDELEEPVPTILYCSDEKLEEYTKHMCKTDLASYYIFLAVYYFEEEGYSYDEEKYDCYCKAFDLLSSENDVCVRTIFELMRVGIGCLDLEYFDNDERSTYLNMAENCIREMENIFDDWVHGDSILYFYVSVFILKGKLRIKTQKHEDALLYYLAAEAEWEKLTERYFLHIEKIEKFDNYIFPSIDSDLYVYILRGIFFLIRDSLTARPERINESTIDTTLFDAQLNFRKEETLFKKRDYVHAAAILNSRLNSTGVSFLSNDELKTFVIKAYSSTAARYRTLGIPEIDEIAGVYEERIKIIEEDFDNRVNAFLILYK